MTAVSDRLLLPPMMVLRDKGFVSDVLKKLLDEGNEYDVVIAIGPPIMMKVVSEVTRPYGIKT